MKGILLAGGKGTRLHPLTRITNKHLIAVYDKPMIMYPLELLTKSGIKDILIISGREHAGHFLEFLGSGADLGINLTYRVQDQAGGIAHALLLAENFAKDDDMTVILCDNIFEQDFKKYVGNFKSGARIFLKSVPDRCPTFWRRGSQKRNCRKNNREAQESAKSIGGNWNISV